MDRKFRNNGSWTNSDTHWHIHREDNKAPIRLLHIKIRITYALEYKMIIDGKKYRIYEMLFTN